ncbi:MAG: hypothetical protein U0R21_00915 [Nocardioidaceae bacterium]
MMLSLAGIDIDGDHLTRPRRQEGKRRVTTGRWPSTRPPAASMAANSKVGLRDLREAELGLFAHP